MRTEKSGHLREMAFTALFAALLVISTWISLPGEPPFTMQTFAVFAAALLMGRRAVAAVAVYLALGALGVPVFAGFSGGIGHLAGITGGFAVGFLPAAYVAGWVAERTRRVPVRALGCAAGLAICYMLGTVWFLCVASDGSAGLAAALAGCVIPFILPDAAKIALALLIARRLERAHVFPL